jgi:protein-S-isoprenylcysteine O-methyltransferase Ste14
MRKPVAAIGSLVFFLVAPGTVIGLVPWWLTGWHMRAVPGGWLALTVAVRVIGAILALAGVSVVAAAFVRFVVEGLGTPAPVAPPRHLVIGGLYRYVRNPMYVALLTCLLGQALLLSQPVLVGYAAIVAAATVAFVMLYEQPALTRRFGSEYQAYRKAVPGWWPRMRPWHPPAEDHG